MTLRTPGALWPGILVFLVLAPLRMAGCHPLATLEERVTDHRLVARGGGAPPHEAVCIVAVDDESIERVGRWPWPRSTMAVLMQRIAAAQARVVAVDIVQSEATAGPGGANEDALLAAALSRAPIYVLGYFFDFARPALVADYSLVRPYDIVRVQDPRGLAFVPPRGEAGLPTITGNLVALTRAAKDLGYFNFFPDSDGTLRRAPLALRYGDEVVVPLALAALRQATGEQARIRIGSAGVEEVALGKTRIPVDRSGALRIDYRGGTKTFPHYPAAEVLAGRIGEPELRNKIVLLGVTATAVYDLRVTPFAPAFPGVEIHANVIDNVLQGRFLRAPEWMSLVEVVAMAVFALGTAWIVARTRGLLAALGPLLLWIAYWGFSEWCLWQRGVIVPVLGTTVAAVATFAASSVRRYLWEERERRKIRRALELYLSPTAAALVSDHPERLKLGGEKVECTVLFSDVKDFTALAERLPPEHLVELLNAYLGAMTQVVFAHGGMLDKYIGDGIMAVWGVPLPHPEQAAAACRAALAMQQKLDELRPDWNSRGWPRLDIRIGIHTGLVVFGNMGSTEHLSLTVVGDNVNLAARLEGLNKFYGTQVLLTEATVRRVSDDFVVREIDTVRVKGRAQPVRVFELLAWGEETRTPELQARIERFAAGLQAYRHGDFRAAERIFAALAEDHRDDGPARVFLARCRTLVQERPPHWEPVTTLEEK